MELDSLSFPFDISSPTNHFLVLEMDHISSRRFYLPGYGYRQGLSVSRQDQSTLNSIPTELVDMILKHLPPESVIAFALTCRTHFLKHWPFSKSARDLPLLTRAALLQLLEPDIPRLYFCHGCAYLHPWRATLREGGNPPCYRKQPVIEFEPLARAVVSHRRIDLTYFWARIVMNGHLRGALHGPPVQDMQKTQPFWYHSDGDPITTDHWSGRIIGDNLYLHGTTVMRSDGKNRYVVQSLRSHINRFDRFESLVCRHLRPSMISELCHDEESSQPRPFHPTSEISRIIRSCPVCFTDFQIHVSVGYSTRQKTSKSGSGKPMEGKDWSIQIDRWLNLGQCRSPCAPEWRNRVTNSPARLGQLVRREHACAAGMVYRMWMGDNMVSAPVTETAQFSNAYLDSGI